MPVQGQFVLAEEPGNPGERLYRRGMQMNKEKAKIIESVRKELAEKEIKEHCTFRPKLQTKDFYASRSALNRFFELKRVGDE